MTRLCDWFRSLCAENPRNNTNTSKETQKYAKDSFDRFGDDLIRLLLSYHSYDEKFGPFESRSRHECVSKQFQRCIYDTINEIHTGDGLIARVKAKEVDLSDEDLCLKFVAFHQKKCPNIVEITHDLWEKGSYCGPLLQAMDQLRNDWPHLKCVDFNDGFLMENFFDNQIYERLKVFSLMVKKITIITNELIPYEEDFPNLCSLSTPYLDMMFTANDNHLMAFNHLKDIRFYWVNTQYNCHRFKAFFDYYSSRLQILEYFMNDINISEDSETNVTQFLTQLSKLKELKELKLDLVDDSILHFSLYDNLKTIGLKCLKLKRLSLNVQLNNTGLNVEIMNCIQFIPHLKRLHLMLRSREYPKTDWTKLEPLDRWPHLTHLSINLWEYTPQLLKDIVSTQSTLQTFNCYIKDNMNTKWLGCVSRLSKLQLLSIKSKDGTDFRKSDIKTILKKCTKLRSIEINNRFDANILNKTNESKKVSKSVKKSHSKCVIL